MQRDQAEHQRLQVLHQIVKHTQSLGVGRLGHIHQRTDLGRFKADMLAANLDLQLLPAVLVLLWPLSVVFPIVAVSTRLEGWIRGPSGGVRT